MNEEASKPKTQEEQKKPAGVVHKRGEDFIDRYANNTFFESSAWDLKVIFGSVDQSIAPNHVTQHTGISLSWAQVKVLIFLLRFQMIAHEARLGKVRLPPGIINPIPAIPPADIKAFLGTHGGSGDIEAYKKARALYEEFIATNPEAAPIEEQSDSKSSTQ
ncbi:MAG: hypothetical protein ACLPVW_09815 [Terriglobales bacterium]